MIVSHDTTGGFFFGEDAKLLMGKSASPRLMNELGYGVFLMAQTPSQIVGLNSRVLYTKEYRADGDTEDKGPAPLERLVHANGRFECCEHTGATVSEALRRNNLFPAALHGVFMRCMNDHVAPSSDFTARKYYAIPIDSESEDRNVQLRMRAASWSQSHWDVLAQHLLEIVAVVLCETAELKQFAIEIFRILAAVDDGCRAKVLSAQRVYRTSDPAFFAEFMVADETGDRGNSNHKGSANDGDDYKMEEDGEQDWVAIDSPCE